MRETPIASTWAARRLFDRACADCGETIGRKRMAAVPDAERCVRCQAIVDKPLVAGPMAGATFDDMNSADFTIVRARQYLHRSVRVGPIVGHAPAS